MNEDALWEEIEKDAKKIAKDNPNDEAIQRATRLALEACDKHRAYVKKYTKSHEGGNERE